MFDLLESGIAAMAATDLRSLPGAERTAALVEVARLRNMLDAAEATHLADWDADVVWAESGAKSGAALLAFETRQPRAECGARLANARATRKLPAAAAAWRAGEISGAHLRLLSANTNERTAEFMARDEAILVGQAKTLTFTRFAQAIAYWSLRADPDGTSRKALERRHQRDYRIRQVGDTYVVSGTLDPLSGEAIAGEHARRERELFRADWAEAKARLGREPNVSELRRTNAQRRADAAVDIAARSAASTGAAAKPLISVILGDQALAQVCELERTGQVIPPSALRDWLPAATLEAILFEPGTRRIQVSRKRSFTGAMRRLIQVRDRTCYHPTCEDRADTCQGDHIEPHGAGGLTSPTNGRLACPTHNRARHRRHPPDPPA